MLTVGDKFPEFDLTACVSLEKGKEFEQINHKTYEGKWKIVFAWPKDFTFVRSIEIVAMVVLGGIGSISGALVAAVLLTVLPEVLRPLQDYTGVDFRMVIYAGLLVVLMLVRPQGLFGSRELFGLGRRGGPLKGALK